MDINLAGHQFKKNQASKLNYFITVRVTDVKPFLERENPSAVLEDFCCMPCRGITRGNDGLCNSRDRVFTS